MENRCKGCYRLLRRRSEADDGALGYLKRAVRHFHRSPLGFTMTIPQTIGHNPDRVDDLGAIGPRVVPRLRPAGQPWAGRWNPVGIRTRRVSHANRNGISASNPGLPAGADFGMS